MSLAGKQIARQIPPFHPKIRVRPMITRKLETTGRDGSGKPIAGPRQHLRQASTVLPPNGGCVEYHHDQRNASHSRFEGRRQQGKPGIKSAFRDWYHARPVRIEISTL